MVGSQMKTIDTTKEGWSDDIASRGKRHYYKDGVSLCGIWKQKFYFRHFDKDSIGSKHSCDCVYCIKKLKQLKTLQK